MIEVLIYTFLCVQIFIVALYDIKYKKISNQWSILNISLFVAFLFLFPESYQLSMDTVFYSLTFLALGFVCYMLRLLGGGDSKYLFSLFLLTPYVWQDRLFYFLLISTMVIGGFSLLTSFVQNFEKIMVYAKSGYAKGIGECLGNKFPYAPVILMAWLWLGFHVFYLA